MRKTLLTYLAVLAGIFIVLSFVDAKGSYEAEKVLWKIDAQFEEYTKDPKIIPMGTYEGIRKKYARFIETHPKSNLVPLAELHIGHTYMAMKDYDKAHVYFEDFIKKHADNLILGVQAAVEITRTYALEENEAGVIKSYDRIIRDFPLTDIGLKTPMLVVDFYKHTKQKARQQKALEDAETHYKGLIVKNPDSPVELKALQMLANCYVEKGDFPKAVDALEEILLKFSDPRLLTPQAMKNLVTSINAIAITQLKNYDRPIEIYSQFLEKYPNHPAAASFKSLIAKFKMLKKENVSVILKKK